MLGCNTADHCTSCLYILSATIKGHYPAGSTCIFFLNLYYFLLLQPVEVRFKLAVLDFSNILRL